ncbi:hypothetical protein B0H14DRAFT_2921223 [Mycena olivaceomarginata]|nr:hypothetical protein B0H14DRAFT_2921223 [Mycena olivaceomarginata]
MVAALPFDSRIYAALGPRDGWDAVDLMACINGAIECSRQLLDYESALLWVEEAETLDKYLEAEARASSFEWVQIQSASSDYYYFERLTTLCLASQVFFALGNTASAILKLAPLLGIDILSLRHPDPESAATLSIDHARLQLRGSWKKLHIRSSSTLGSRMHCARGAFDGQLYVLGGEKHTDPDGPSHRDFWVLDLEKLDGWRRLPDFPPPEELTGELGGFQMAPHGDGRIFVFLGWPAAIAVFDTTQCTWEMMKTTFVHDAHMHTWPYYDWRVTEYTAQCVGDRLYIFGGIHGGSVIGTDLLMELHIPSRKWRRLSGSGVPRPCASSPGPRERCHSWVGPLRPPFYSPPMAGGFRLWGWI